MEPKPSHQLEPNPVHQWARVDQLLATIQIFKWLPVAVLVGIMAGTGSAALLAALEWATRWREAHLWILYFLPLGGLASGLMYHYLGKNVEAGNNLLLEEVHSPQKVVPVRMAPLVLIGTVLTHFFGGSAGREGTAIQISGSLADQLTQWLRLSNRNRRILLMAGISGGFGSVFGIPISGTLFGLEVLTIGTYSYEAIFPCLVASVVGYRVTLLWGIEHPVYSAFPVPPLSLPGLVYSIITGAACGTVAMVFARLTHRLGHWFKVTFPYAPLRPVVGGVAIAVIVVSTGATQFIGLGVSTILEAFSAPLPPWDFAAKLGLTALTLGAGFKGGEVTPLFFIGATLGNALALVLPLPRPLLAGMGLAAVFAGAANTPVSSTVMAFELFGHQAGLYGAIACVVSYLFSGHRGIYGAQRIGQAKHPLLPRERS